MFQAIANWWDRLFDMDTPMLLKGDGTWPFTVTVDGQDLVFSGVATCFGGGDDPQDDGSTASGINTKTHPAFAACSLAMDGRQFPGASHAEHAQLDGCPIPRLPFNTTVEVTIRGVSASFPVIDLGPAKDATDDPKRPHVVDLTAPAARRFDANANARNFEEPCTVRIIGGAKFIPAKC